MTPNDWFILIKESLLLISAIAVVGFGCEFAQRRFNKRKIEK